ncbi:MAG: Omp28-related outer membrane protein [Ignavibacteria bacterium]
MKKLITIFSLFVMLVSFSPNKSYSQNNALLEYCTGTWCGYCPCGHEFIDQILTNYPNTVVLSYHGGTGDPWLSYSAGIRSLFGYTGYPSGSVGRKTGIIDRNAWNNEVVLQSALIQPGVSIVISNKAYDATSRTLTVTVVITALTDLTGDFNINYVLTENNLIYPQNYYSACGTPGYVNDYVHDHVAKNMMNGDLGEVIHTGTWTTGQEVTRNLSYVVPISPQVIEPNNCDINIFVYKQGTSISTNSNVQQAMRTPLTTTVGIQNQSSIIQDYGLTQNYPNPFNPTTNFSFSIPKDGNVSLKFYDVLGNEVDNYVNGFLKAGVYSVEFDGSNLSSGIYFYTLSTNEFNLTKRMILTK